MNNYIIIKDKKYFIDNFNHPGGNIILYSNKTDATDLFNSFHYRSKKTLQVLKSLPFEKINTENNEMLEDFERWRKDLIDRGMFTTDNYYINLYLVNILLLFFLGIIFIGNNIFISLLFFSLCYGQCGLMNHEAGHNSLTGNIKKDRLIQNMLMGLGLSLYGDSWNEIHNRHHAATQKIKFDLDTDSVVAYFKGAVEKNKFTAHNKYFLKYQKYIYFSIGTFIVLLYLQIFDHFGLMIRKKDYRQIIISITSLIVKILLFHYIGDYSIIQSIILYLINFWLVSIYLFSHFLLSHSYTPIINEDENKNWVENALEHTIDFSTDNLFVCWITGYLNHQTVHHLFLSLPYHNLNKVSKELIKFCNKWNLKYQRKTYYEVFKLMLGNLDNVGNYYYNL